MLFRTTVVVAFLAGLAAAAPSVELETRKVHAKEWDCKDTPESCNNACYAVACKGKSWTLEYNGGGKAADDQRVLSGAAVHPCAKNPLPDGVKQQNNDRDLIVADEYPFASSKEGGVGAILRCTTEADGEKQGGQISSIWSGVKDGEKVKIALKGADEKSSPFCAPFIGKHPPAAHTVCDNRAGFEFMQDASTVHSGAGVAKKFHAA